MARQGTGDSGTRARMSLRDELAEMWQRAKESWAQPRGKLGWVIAAYVGVRSVVDLIGSYQTATSFHWSAAWAAIAGALDWARWYDTATSPAANLILLVI